MNNMGGWQMEKGGKKNGKRIGGDGKQWEFNQSPSYFCCTFPFFCFLCGYGFVHKRWYKFAVFEKRLLLGLVALFYFNSDFFPPPFEEVHYLCLSLILFAKKWSFSPFNFAHLVGILSIHVFCFTSAASCVYSSYIWMCLCYNSWGVALT